MGTEPDIEPSRLWEIHGKYYDLEPFLDKHPGGRRFLEQARGMDCTALFESTHLHDRIPKASLRKYWVADVPDHAPEFEWAEDGFYLTLKRRVREHFTEDAKRRGLTGRSLRYAHHGTREFVVRLVVLWLVFAELSVGAIGFGQWWCALAWGPVAFALGGYGHEAMHAGVFASPRANRAAALMTLDFMGLSSFVFTATHVPLHHIHTNVVDRDPDIEVHFPTVRERPSQPLFWFHRFQHLYAWAIYFITFPVLWVVDFLAVSTGTWFGPWGKLRRPYAREVAWFGAFKVISLCLWYVLPYLLHPWPTALLINALMIGSAGLIVQTTFALNHQNELAMLVGPRPSTHPRDWGVQQLETTADFHHGHWLPVMFFGGLGFQIEHHLFPTLSYSRLAEIAPIVRRTCEEFGVPYFYYPNVGRAILAHYRFLRRMGRRAAAAASSLVLGSMLGSMLGIGPGCDWNTPPTPPPTAPPTTPAPREPAKPRPREPAPSVDAFVEVTAGDQHTCARRRSGTVACWGRNTYGQLGNGSREDSTAMVAVTGLSDAVELAAGTDFTCARRKSGAVACWGNDQDGQLGDGLGAKVGVWSTRPSAVAGLSDATAIAAGDYFACALRRAGNVVCWGEGADGQVGAGGARAFPRPQAIAGVSEVVSLGAGGRHVCVAEHSGRVLCWGRNTEGQLGDGGNASRYAARPVQGLADAQAVVGGGRHTCASRRGGGLSCWGDGAQGQLGLPGHVDRQRTPKALSGLSGVRRMVAGDQHTCALVSAGDVRCWGDNADAQIDASRRPQPVPHKLAGVRGVVDVAAGRRHTCVISGEKVYCWGLAERGALGQNPLTRETPAAG